MIFAYRNVDSPDGDFGLVKQEGDERFVVLTVEEYAALRETEARANTAKGDAEKAERERGGLRSAMDADNARLLAASEKVGRPPMGCDTADDLADAILGLRAERDALRSLMGDAIKCVSLVNANGYYDSWLARARTLSRLDDALGEG